MHATKGATRHATHINTRARAHARMRASAAALRLCAATTDFNVLLQLRDEAKTYKDQPDLLRCARAFVFFFCRIYAARVCMHVQFLALNCHVVAASASRRLWRRLSIVTRCRNWYVQMLCRCCLLSSRVAVSCFIIHSWFLCRINSRLMRSWARINLTILCAYRYTSRSCRL